MPREHKNMNQRVTNVSKDDFENFSKTSFGGYTLLIKEFIRSCDDHIAEYLCQAARNVGFRDCNAFLDWICSPAFVVGCGTTETIINYVNKQIDLEMPWMTTRLTYPTAPFERNDVLTKIITEAWDRTQIKIKQNREHP